MDQIARLLENQNRIFDEMMQQMQAQRINPAAPVVNAVQQVSQQVPLPPPLAVEGDMEENFSFFEGNWRNYATAVGMEGWPVDENPKKVSFLLSVVGTQALKKYFNFELTAADKQDPDTVLAAIKQKVVHTRNIIVDRLDFFTAVQSPLESIDDFVSRLKASAKPCRFGALEQEMLTFKIVTSNKWSHLKSKMLTITNITADKAIDLCRMEEITAKHSQALFLDKSGEVNKVQSAKARKCKYCGDWHAFVKGSCPAYGKRCKKCNGRNHFEKVCRAEKPKVSKRGKSRRVKEIRDGDSSETGDSEEEEDYSDYSEEVEVEGEIGKIFDSTCKGSGVMAELELKVDHEWKKVLCDLDWLKKLTGNSSAIAVQASSFWWF